MSTYNLEIMGMLRKTRFKSCRLREGRENLRHCFCKLVAFSRPTRNLLTISQLARGGVLSCVLLTVSGCAW